MLALLVATCFSIHSRGAEDGHLPGDIGLWGLMDGWEGQGHQDGWILL